jgi:hypothetical protein
MVTVHNRSSAALITVLLLVSAAPAFAEDNHEVEPGGAFILKSDLQGTVSDLKATKGSAGVAMDGAGKSTLVYVAPNDVRDADDEVNYKIGGQQQSAIKVAVRPQAPTLNSPQLYNASFKALFALFILAVLVENGLALLFRWRPYLDFFDTRTTNSFVAFLFSLFLVWLFNLDIANQLISVYTGAGQLKLTGAEGWPGAVLTAMIIAGGSAGVNRIFQSFGFRSNSAQDTPAPPRLDSNQAWVSVTLTRNKAVGPVDVLIQNQVVGTIPGRSAKGGFSRHFFRNKGRSPQSGGHIVVPGVDYKIELRGRDAGGQPQSAEWGTYAIAPRAIIDTTLTV